MDVSTLFIAVLAAVIGFACSGMAALLSIVRIRQARQPVSPLMAQPLPIAPQPQLSLELAGQPDIASVLKAAGKWLHSEYGFSQVVLFAYDPATHELVDPVIFGPDLPVLPRHLRLGSLVYGEVANNRQPRLIDQLSLERRFGPVAQGIQSAYVVPLLYAGTLHGILCVQSATREILNRQMLDAVNGCATVIAASMSTTQHILNNERAIKRFDRFQTLAQRLTTRLDTKNLLQDIVEAACEMLDTQMSALLDIDEESGELKPIAWSGISDEVAALLRSRQKEDMLSDRQIAHQGVCPGR